MKSWFRKLFASGLSVCAIGGAMAADPLHTNRTKFNIPFTIDQNDTRSQNGQAILFMSVDGGHMRHVQVVSAEQRKFPFHAPADGLYEFTVRLRDAAGEPLGQQGPLVPDIAIQVDTTPPELNFRLSETAPGEVTVQWNCSESKVSPGSLRLEYAEGTDGRWQQIATTPGASGKTIVKSKIGTAVSVRGFISDLAGNQGTGSSQIVLNMRAGATTVPQPQTSLPATPVGPSPFGNNSQQPFGVTVPDDAKSTHSIKIQPSISQSQTPFINPGASQGDFQNAAMLSGPQVNNFSQNGLTNQQTSPPTTSLGNNSQVIPPSFASPQSLQVANSVMPSDNRFTPSGFVSPPAQPFSNGHPNNLQSSTATNARYSNDYSQSFGPQLVNNSVFNIDYQVDDVGPSGVSAVELFVTEDNGRTWFAYGNDTDLRSPFQVDTQGEGTFGFAVRVRNGLGFRATPPQPGELPSIVVTVDKTGPTAELGQPQVVTNNGVQVRLAWQIREANPGNNPVRLEYAANPNGPWIPAFDWQADTGNYTLPVHPGMPMALHFRLLARDAAGNVTATQTTRPVLVDQMKPTARLLRIQPVASGQRL